MSSENQPLQTAEEKRSYNFCLANIKVIARTLGLVTVAVMWIATVIIIKDYNSSYVGYYLIASSAVVTFFELTWIMDKLACCVREGCCCRIWAAVMWVDNWKKFILYVVLSVPLFLEDIRLILGIVTGLLLILLSTVYLIKTFRSYVAVSYEKVEQRQITTVKTRTVTHEIAIQTDVEQGVNSAFNVTEVPDDGGSVSSPSQK